MVSVGFLSLPSVGVGVEDVRFVEPVQLLKKRKSISKFWLMRIN
jgi:hypothetical protein